MFDDELEPVSGRGRPAIGSGGDDERPRARRRLRSMDVDPPSSAPALTASTNGLLAASGPESSAAQELDEMMRPPRQEADVQTMVVDWFQRSGLDAAIAAARRALQQDRDVHPEPDIRLAALDAMLTELERVRILDAEGLKRALSFARLAARVPPEPWKVGEWIAFLSSFCPHSAATPPGATPYSAFAIVRVDETNNQLYLYMRHRPLLETQRGASLYAPDVVVARAIHAAAQSAPEDRRIQIARQQLALSALSLKTAIENICHLSTPHIPRAVPRVGVFLWARGTTEHPIDVPDALLTGMDLSQYVIAVCCDAYDRRARAYTPAEARARADELYRECHRRYNGFVWDELPRGDVPPAAFVAVQNELRAPDAPFPADAPPPMPEPFLHITGAQQWTDDTRACFLAAVAHAVLLTPIDSRVLPADFQKVLLMPNLVAIDDQSQTGKSVLMELISSTVWRTPLAMDLSEDQFGSAGISQTQSLVDLGDQKLDGWGPHKIRDSLRWTLKWCDGGQMRVRLMRTDTFAPETQLPRWEYGQPRRADVVLTTNARLALPWENMRRMMYFTHMISRSHLRTDASLDARMKAAYATLLLLSVHALHMRLLVRGPGERDAMWSEQQHAWVAALLRSQSVIMRFAKDTMTQRDVEDKSLEAAKLWLLGCKNPVQIDSVFWARFKEWTEKLPPADRPYLRATAQSIKEDLRPTGIELLTTTAGEFLPFFEWNMSAPLADGEFGWNRS